MIKYGILNFFPIKKEFQMSDRIFENYKEAQKVIDKVYKSGTDQIGQWRNKKKRSVVVSIDVRELDYNAMCNLGGFDNETESKAN